MHDIMHDTSDIAVRSMFGGFGLYHQGVFFGIIADETLYLYTQAPHDHDNVFTYMKKGVPVSLRHYVHIDESFLDDPESAYERIVEAIQESKARSH